MRVWGVGEDLIGEADARLREDGEAGWRWLEGRMAELCPSPDAPICDYCWAPVAESGWTGEARVTCSGCGAVWEVEARRPGSWSLSGVKGPSEEWLAAHPPGSEEDEYDPVDVLDGDLPGLRDRIGLGEAHPVAKWQDDLYGAVLYVTREETRPGDFPGDEYGHDIEYCQRDERGSWMGIGSGGGRWVNPLSVPADLIDKYGLIGTNVASTGMGDDRVYFTGGLVRRGIVYAEVHDAKGIARYPIDQQSRIFLVGGYGPGWNCSVHLLNADGAAARGHNGLPIIINMT